MQWDHSQNNTKPGACQGRACFAAGFVVKSICKPSGQRKEEPTWSIFTAASPSRRRSGSWIQSRRMCFLTCARKKNTSRDTRRTPSCSRSIRSRPKRRLSGFLPPTRRCCSTAAADGAAVKRRKSSLPSATRASMTSAVSSAGPTGWSGAKSSALSAPFCSRARLCRGHRGSRFRCRAAHRRRKRRDF